MSELLRVVGGRIGAAGFLSLALLSLAGCESMPPLFQRHTSAQTADEVGDVYVTPLPAVPWAAISDKLSPDIKLSIADARTMAMQSTQTQVDQFMSTFALGLGVNLSGTARSSEVSSSNVVKATTSSDTSKNTDSSESSTTSTSKETQSTGAIPAASGKPDVAGTGPSVDFSKSPAASGVDGNTVLVAQTALFQQAKLLDEQLRQQYLPAGYRASLVTFQVNLQPHVRDGAYDAYTQISLIPANFDEAVEGSRAVQTDTAGLPPVIVYPVLVTDAFETTSVGRSIQAIRQVALELAGLVGGAGLRAGVGGGSNHAQSVVGLDKNNLITVGRINDSTIRVRIGAENSATAGQAMVPRGYNVAVLVLSRWMDEPKVHIQTLKGIARTDFWSIEGRKWLRPPAGRARSDLSVRVLSTLRGFGVDKIKDADINKESLQPPPAGEPLSEVQEAALDLLRAVDRGDYASLSDWLSGWMPAQNAQATQDVQRRLQAQRLIATLLSIQANSHNATFSVPVPLLAVATLPDVRQLALYSLEEKSPSMVRLQGGEALTGKPIRAYLALPGDKRIGSSRSQVSDDGRGIELTFPPLAAVVTADELQLTRLHVESPGATGSPAIYELRRIQEAKEQKPAR
jgi:hypothetical protein